MHRLTPALLLSVLLSGCTLLPQHDDASHEVHGHLSLGPQLSALRPCGSEHSWQVTTPAPLDEQLEARYLQQTGAPYEEAYLRARVQRRALPADCRDCQEHTGLLQLDELLELRAASARDCH